MLLAILSCAHALAYVRDPFSAAPTDSSAVATGNSPTDRGASLDSNPDSSSLARYGDAGQRHSKVIIHRQIGGEGNDSIFESDFREDMVKNGQGGPQLVEKEKVRTDLENVQDVLEKQMEELSPEIYGKIASSIKSKDVDRNKYRDLFLIKKRIITDGASRIVTFDIKERIVPRIATFSLGKDIYTKFLLAGILILLLSLVLTTTIRMYRVVMADHLSIQLNTTDSIK